MSEGIIYLLTNPAMPGLVKIGYTLELDVKKRMGQLYNTPGIPVPFECAYAGRVRDAVALEKALHIAFGPQRINPRREFFQIEPAQAIGIIKYSELKDETQAVAIQHESAEVDNASKEAGEELRRKRPRFSFALMGIPVGSTLVSNRDGSEAIVLPDNQVRYHDQEMSLTAATRALLGIDYSVQPGPFWTYDGRLFSDIYDEVYTMN